MGMDGEYERSRFPSPTLICDEYDLFKETPKGYWIGYGHFGKLHSSWTKWVSKTARKRYAYPTKEEALVNFKARTKKRMEILHYQALSCSLALGLADNETKKLENEYKTGS